MDSSSLPVIDLDEAKRLTGLSLASAKDIVSETGLTYHELEEQSESKSHDTARQEAIRFFCSIGYRVYPSGIGVLGEYTLADFLAVRDNRVVFVEVLSDSNIKPETLDRKAKLQSYGELCFVFYCGNKIADETGLKALKYEVHSWADVLYCQIHAWSGNHIRSANKASVSYDTTRDKGIVVEATFERTGRKLQVCFRFQTHLYTKPTETPISYPVLPRSYCYEEIFLDIFKEIARKTGRSIKLASRKKDAEIKAMRRKSGLKMLGADERIAITLKSEYRGSEEIEESYSSKRFPSTRDLPVNDFYCIATLEKTGMLGLEALFDAVKEYGLTIDYETNEFEKCLHFLSKQDISLGKGE